jgi:hypothetical protein
MAALAGHIRESRGRNRSAKMGGARVTQLKQAENDRVHRAGLRRPPAAQRFRNEDC